MAVNKVVINNQTVIDLTGDTVTAEKLALGVTAHGSDGNIITGSASIEPYAMIYAHFLSGATVTCSDGVTTLTAQVGGEDWAFLLPNAGTWTVTAAIGGVTTSKTVSVTEQYQAEYVNLGRIYLLRDGVNVSGSNLITAWYINNEGGHVNYTPGTGIVFTVPKSGSGHASSVQFQDMVDFGSSPNFSKLCAFFSNVTGTWGGYQSRQVGIADVLMSGRQAGIWTNTSNVSSTFFTSKAYDTGGSGATSVTLQLDVSGVTGQHYAGVMTTKLDSICTDIWLE